jgi:hypothetical protein
MQHATFIAVNAPLKGTKYLQIILPLYNNQNTDILNKTHI